MDSTALTALSPVDGRYRKAADGLRAVLSESGLIREIRESADPATKIVLIDLKDGWLGGVDIERIGEVCDGMILCCYDMQPDDLAALIMAARAKLGSGTYLGAGFRLFYPEMKSPDELAVRVRAVAAAGADGINFYNYGLVPAKRLDWVRHALDGLLVDSSV